MSNRNRMPQPPVNVRLAQEGTRVVMLVGAPPYAAGIISQVRPQTNLKSYVVTRDDGVVVYASAYDLAREDDALVHPLGARRQA